MTTEQKQVADELDVKLRAMCGDYEICKHCPHDKEGDEYSGGCGQKIAIDMIIDLRQKLAEVAR